MVIRGDLGWVKLQSERHERALKYAGRLRAMNGVRWPKIVGEALLEIRGRGSWVDYVQAQITKYRLRDTFG